MNNIKRRRKARHPLDDLTEQTVQLVGLGMVVGVASKVLNEIGK